MGELLTIEKLVLSVKDFLSEERTPFAATPWEPSSQVIWQDADTTSPILENGLVYEYFLEPDVIDRVLDFGPATPQEAVTRVIQYAINDA